MNASAPFEVGMLRVDDRAHEMVARSFGLGGGALTVFRHAGRDVRVIVIDGEPWFVLADLCAVLGVSNARDVAARLDETQKGVGQIDTPGGRQGMTIVNEPGMYEVVFRSDKPEAVALRRWISGDVLPSLRKTGMYSIAPATPALPQSYAEALRELAASVEAREALAAQVSTLAPRAEAWDEMASADGDYSVADAAAMLNRAGISTGRDRLFAKLAELRWIYRGEKGRWRPFASTIDAGYMTERAQPPHRDGDGELVPSPPQVRITLRGLERLRIRLGVLTDVATP